jgi:uncharacterized membrane protein
VSTTRLEAFSDAVVAILITIMVLELHVPHGDDYDAIRPLLPVFLTYVLSFVYLGIYWNNHHHMIRLTERVNGTILWANLHLLFWLSLIPFTTAWMGEEHLAALPTALYGGVLMMAGVAYFILKTTLIRAEGPGSRLQAALGSDFKGKISVVLYLVAIVLSFVNTWLATLVYTSVALIWLVPDRRIERNLGLHP